MKILQPGAKQWGHTSKVEARRKTIIEPYQAVFGQTLPRDRQYWTLCGELGPDGYLQTGCELDQVVSSELIEANQFHGVEGNIDIHHSNIRAIQRSDYPDANLYYGEFTEVLDQALGNGNLTPGIVYLDTIQEPHGASRLLARTLDILNHTKGSTLLTWNFIYANRHRNRHHTWKGVLKELENNQLFLSTIGKGWEQFGEEIVFRYEGTGKSSTTMGTVVFVRQ
jgi:hypothetical protein